MEKRKRHTGDRELNDHQSTRLQGGGGFKPLGREDPREREILGVEGGRVSEEGDLEETHALERTQNEERLNRTIQRGRKSGEEIKK